MLKKIALVVILLIIIGASAVYYLWNKPHPKASDSTGIPVTSLILSKEYNTNEKAADAKYLNKVLTVTGKVIEIEKKEGNVLTLETEDGTGILCPLTDTNAKIEKGQMITLKGFCIGNNLGVALKDCEIVK